MKFWLCVCLFSWVTVFGMAQHSDGSCRWEEDSVLLHEFEAMCHRQVDWKLLEAERRQLDTLPAIQGYLENYRKQLAYQQVQEVASPSESFAQAGGKVGAGVVTWRAKIRQVFKALPQNITVASLRRSEHLMDSLYQAVQQGANWEACVQRFSDKKKAVWMSRLEVPVELEQQLDSMKIGEISKPFFTPLGIHMVQLLEKKVESGSRTMKSAKYSIPMSEETFAHWVDSLKVKYDYVPNRQGIQDLLKQSYTERVLFTLQGESFTGDDFELFARYYPAGPSRQFDAYLLKSLLDKAYQDLEEEHPSIRSVLKVCRDSLLVRACCKEQFVKDGVWQEEYLQAYFEQHRSNYHQKMLKFRGVVIQATNKKVAKQVRKLFKKLPESEWSEVIRLTFTGNKHPEVKVEEGFYALGDHPLVDHRIFKQGEVVPLATHPVVVVMGQKVKYSLHYQDVRAEVIRDAVKDWEKQWLSRLQSNN